MSLSAWDRGVNVIMATAGMGTEIVGTGDLMRALVLQQSGGVVVTGNEDGAHHVITEIAGALIDVGFTIPVAYPLESTNGCGTPIRPSDQMK